MAQPGVNTISVHFQSQLLLSILKVIATRVAKYGAVIKSALKSSMNAQLRHQYAMNLILRSKVEYNDIHNF